MNKDIFERIKNSLKQLEDGGYLPKTDEDAVYSSANFLRVTVPYEDAVPVRGAVPPGRPQTRNDLNREFKK